MSDPDSHVSPELASLLRSVGNPARLSRGETLVRQGDPADVMQLLLSGRLEVFDSRGAGDERTLGSVEPVALVGESALISGARRTASVRAVEECELVILDPARVRALEHEHAAVRELVHRLVLARMPSLRMTTAKLFGGLERAILDALEAAFTWVDVPAGEVIFRRGEASDCLYVVAHGRLAIPQRVGEPIEMARGEVVGELGLATGEPRSATVVVSRDCGLLRLSRDDFDRIASEHPAIFRALVHPLVERLRMRTSEAQRSPRRRRRALALLSVDGQPLDSAIAYGLAGALQRYGSVGAISAESFDVSLGSGAAESLPTDRRASAVADWLDTQEQEHDFLVYRAGPLDSEWTARCLRQSDVVLLVARAAERARAREAASELMRRHPGLSDAHRELILVHPAGADSAADTDAWLDLWGPETHHHLRTGNDGDLARLARRLAGRAVGLVLGGGGARGFAHIGVIRAMQELGIPIDRIGGTSAGAVLGGLFASGREVGELVALSRAAFVESRVHRAYTYPAVSLLSGVVPRRLLADFFGERVIEDLWTNFFCVSTCLTTTSTFIHRAGPLATAVLASGSVPALFPPVFSEGRVLVDGGLANNIPVDIMSASEPGIVVASDVSPERSLSVPTALAHPPGGFQLFLDRWFRRRRRRYSGPRLGEILQRTIEYNSVLHKAVQRRHATLYLTPPVEGYSMMAGEQIDEIVERAYRYALEELPNLTL